MPGTALDTGNIIMNQTDKVLPNIELTFQWGREKK